MTRLVAHGLIHHSAFTAPSGVTVVTAHAFRASLIAVTSNWRSGLEAYVSGLREQESRQVRRAFAYIGAAEESQREAKELVER